MHLCSMLYLDVMLDILSTLVDDPPITIIILKKLKLYINDIFMIKLYDILIMGNSSFRCVYCGSTKNIDSLYYPSFRPTMPPIPISMMDQIAYNTYYLCICCDCKKIRDTKT